MPCRLIRGNFPIQRTFSRLVPLFLTWISPVNVPLFFPYIKSRMIFAITQTSVLTFILAAICMPFLPVSITRPALKLVRPAANLNGLPINATRFAGILSPFALFSSSASSNQNEMSAPKVQKSNNEWQAQLSPQQVSPASSSQRSRPNSGPRAL